MLQCISSTTQVWIVTRRQYRISALVSQTSFRVETSGGVAKYLLLSQAITGPVLFVVEDSAWLRMSLCFCMLLRLQVCRL